MNSRRSIVRSLVLTAAFILALARLPKVLDTSTSESLAAVDPNAPVAIPADVPSSGDPNLDQIIFKTGEKYGVDPRLIHAVILQESRYVPTAKSGVGAQGLMLLMPETAKRFGCDDPTDEWKYVDAGTKYLRFLLRRFDGDVTLVAAGLNAGEGNVEKYKGVPPFPETEKYVRNITGNYGKTYHPVLSPEDARVAFGLEDETISKSITIHGARGYSRMSLTRLPNGSSKLTINESVTFDSPDENVGAGRIEVLTVSRVDGCEVYDKRIYYAPALNPDKVRKFRELSSPADEMLPVGAEFTFWAGEGDDATPISDKVTITVQPKNNIPVTLQLKDSVASSK